MMIVIFAILAFICSLDGSHGGIVPPVAFSPLRICAFNIRVFGTTKVEKTEVVDNLIKILLRCDLALIQEIRDSSDTAFLKLKGRINEEITTANGAYGDLFHSVISTKLGRSSSKEQYGFLYRRNLLSVRNTYQYPESKDLFERPPFVVWFDSQTTVVKNFAVLALHSKPSMAVEEVDNITRVYDEITRIWDLKDVLVAGDLNSDCSYLSDNDHKKIGLYSDPRFKWLIGDDVDTTTGNSECSYDRYIAAGTSLQNAVVPDSATVFKFDKEYGLTEEQANDVSDHYPIEVLLAGIPNMAVQSRVEDSKSVESISSVPVENVRKIRELYSKDILAVTFSKKYTVTILKEDTRQYLITAELDKINTFKDVKTEIAHFQNLFPELLTLEMEAVGLALMDSNSFNSDYVYGMNNVLAPYYKTGLACLVETKICTLRVEKHLS